MTNSKVIAWDLVLLVGFIQFLSTKNWNYYNLIIGLTTTNALRYAVKYQCDKYIIAGNTY